MYGDDYDDFGPYTSEVEDLNDFDDMSEFIDDYDDLEASMEEGVAAYGGSSIYEDGFGAHCMGDDDFGDDFDDDDFGDDDFDDDDFGDDDFDDDDDDAFGLLGLSTLALIAAGTAAAGGGGAAAAIRVARRNKRYTKNVGRYVKNRQKFSSTGKKKYDRRARRQMARLIKLWPKLKSKEGLSSPRMVRANTTAMIQGRPLAGQGGGGGGQQVQQAAMTTNYARRQMSRPMPRPPRRRRRRRRRMQQQQQQSTPDFMQNPQSRPFRPPMRRRQMRRGPMRRGPMRPPVPSTQPVAGGPRFGVEGGMSTTKKVAAGLGIFALGVLASGPVMEIIDDIRY